MIPSSTDSSCLNPNTSDMLSIPHSTSFIDFDGDCRPDIMMTRTNANNSSYVEFYIQKSVNGQQMYCLSSGQGKLILGTDKTLPLIEVADFNRDGMFDLIYARPN